MGPLRKAVLCGARPILAAALLGCGGALAQGVPERAQQDDAPAPLADVCSGDLVTFALPAFGAFDANGDGRIDEREADGCESLETLFERLDVDASGALTRVEYRGYADLWRRRARAFGDDAGDVP